MDPQQQPRPSLCTILSAVMLFASVLLMLINPHPNLLNCLLPFHEVPEGHVGVYWSGGALLNTTSSPGFHLMVPLWTCYKPVQVSFKTDVVRMVPCGTQGGSDIMFDRIEVINRLKREYVFETIRNYTFDYDMLWIYDSVRYEVSKFCSVHTLKQIYIDLFDKVGGMIKEALQAECKRHAPGIEIVRVFVAKPTKPENIKNLFEEMEEKHTTEERG